MAEPSRGMSDRELLVAFVGALRTLLIQLLERRHELLPEHLQDVSTDAWSATDQALDDLRRALTDPEQADFIDARLTLVGLSGASLRFKIAGFDNARSRAQPVQASLLRRWFGRIFGWANVILGSLAMILPPAEVVKEFKEASEQGLRDSEE